MKPVYGSHGFAWLNFWDSYGETCSLQESSAALVPHLWIGRDQMRMHLNQEQVGELLPYLQTFVETGKLKKPEENR